MRTAVVRAAMTVVLTGLSAVALAQTFKSRVDTVRLDALVLDGNQPVLGLTAEDFEVRDDGAVQNVTLLATGSLPLDVILALDMSGSLAAGRLDALRAAADSLLGALHAQDRAAITTFSDAIHRLQPLTHDVDALRRALQYAGASGGTRLSDALFASIGMVTPGDRRSLLIVFSDGLDTSSWLQPAAVIRAAERAEVVIYAVSAARVGKRGILREFTDRTGGTLLEVDSSALTTAFMTVLNEFRQRYVLSYTLPTTPSPGWHEIDVRVKGRRATVRTRSGYRVERR